MSDINYVKIRDSHGDDIYSVDRDDNGKITITPLKPYVDILDTMTMHLSSGTYCYIKISELLINEIMEFVECEIDTSDDDFMINFQEVEDCFPDIEVTKKKGDYEIWIKQ